MPNQTVVVRPVHLNADLTVDTRRNPNQLPVFDVLFAGEFTAGQQVVLQVFEVDKAESANQHAGEVKLGEIAGNLVQAGVCNDAPYFRLKVAGTINETRKDVPRVGFLFQDEEVTPIFLALPSDPVHTASATGDKYRFEGDLWEVELRIAGTETKSPAFPIAWTRRVVPSRFVAANERQATYDWHAGNRVKFYNDASADQNGTAGFFKDVADSIEAAKKFIFIVDWSFHPTLCLNPTKNELADTVGAKLIAKAKAGVFVSILTWSHSSPLYEVANDEGLEILKETARALHNEDLPKNLLWRSTKRGTWGAALRLALWSHHQKFVVIDTPSGDAKGRRDLRAFYGGIDLTKGRFDWGDHPILPTDPAAANFRRPITHRGEVWLHTTSNSLGEKVDTLGTKRDRQVHFDDWYNGEFGVEVDYKVLRDDQQLHVREPWHDVHGYIEGPVAWDFTREFVGRWTTTDHTQAGHHDKAAVDAVFKVFDDVIQDRTQIIPQWETRPNAGPWAAQLLHSMPKMHMAVSRTSDKQYPGKKEFDWKISKNSPTLYDYLDNVHYTPPPYERSIQDSYIRAIRQAERFIYIENQYFLGSGDRWTHQPRPGLQNLIPYEIVERTKKKIQEKKPFHTYIVIPMVPEGPVTIGASNATHSIRNLEWRTIAWMIHQLREPARSAGKTWSDYLSFYFPARSMRTDGVIHPYTNLVIWQKWEGEVADSERAHREKPLVVRIASNLVGRTTPPDVNRDLARRQLAQVNQRYFIYVHCKLMVVDDRYVILGSANINERSMAGDRDSEICVALWPSSNRTQAKCEKQVQDELRGALWREHLGADMPGDWKTPELESCYSAVRNAAGHNYLAMRGGQTMNGHLCLFPFEINRDGTRWECPEWATRVGRNYNLSPGDHRYILDPLDTLDEKQAQAWTWESWMGAIGGWPGENTLPQGIIVE
jgi:phospholipase D1/2